MVRVERVVRKERAPDPPNPYALVDLRINDLPIQGRPIAFDSEPAGNGYLNKAGEPIRPVKCVTVCPECSVAVLEVPLQPGFAQPLELACTSLTSCPRRPAPPPMPDPFCNPFLEGLMVVGDVDTDLLDVLTARPEPGTTVAERIGKKKPKRKIKVNGVDPDGEVTP